MKIAYFDCFAGASGDMILSALIDAGLDIAHLRNELVKLNLTDYTIQAEKDTQKGISGTKFDVKVTNDHHHRGLRDIVGIIDESQLSSSIKNKSKNIFQQLAEAEAKIHNKSVNEIHFHEVGAVDAIVDVVGAVVGLESLCINKVFVSRIHVGTGSLQCAHGTLPVPPPATLELLKNMSIYSTGIENELITPTGAAILSTLSEGSSPIPPMKVHNTGYGLGSRDLPIPNILRLIIGEEIEKQDGDAVQLIETNIDDMNPQFYEYIMESLFEHGAKDVFLTPVIMKKNRPGVVLSVVASPDLIDALIEIIFRETTTLGVRISEIKKRQVMEREIRTLSTPWGEARVKIRRSGHYQTAAPEYDDCKKLAQANHIPIREIFDYVKRQAEEPFNIK